MKHTSPAILLAVVLPAATSGCESEVLVVAEGPGGATTTSSHTATATATDTMTATDTGTQEECCNDANSLCTDCFAEEFAVHGDYFFGLCMCGAEAPCAVECGMFCDQMGPGHEECWLCALNDECTAMANDLCLADPSCAPYFECIMEVTPLEYCGS